MAIRHLLTMSSKIPAFVLMPLLVFIGAASMRDTANAGDQTQRHADVLFENHGTLAGMDGNVLAKLSETTETPLDGNSTSIKCSMIRSEPDMKATGGCHAEVHVRRFPNGELFGNQDGFDRVMTQWQRFDADCDGNTVGFWQLKNCDGEDPWKYLVALWRLSKGNGNTVLLQFNPSGKSVFYYARLREDGVKPMTANTWNKVRIMGHFTTDHTGWMEVDINGTRVTWYHDEDYQQRVGVRVNGQILPSIPSNYSYQCGGYGFFKKPGSTEMSVLLGGITVEH